jgi:hypothetical protein
MVPSEGQVCFVVDPAGAEVFVDGNDMGKAEQFKDPACLVLTLGKHDIQILKSGFGPYTESINVGQAKQFVKARLVAEEGKPTGDQGKGKN